MAAKRDLRSRFSVIGTLVRLRPTPARQAVLFASPHLRFVAAIIERGIATERNKA